ncbi:hypothetical protein BC827DRAFT_1238991 [Russula dissimulans]|nr:hypothetical protein BC827DRAFT_1238991 [Russula dissimulans]
MAAFLLLLPRPAARHAPAPNGRLKEGSRYTWYAPEVANGHRETDGRKIRWEITPPVLWVEKEGWTRLRFFRGDVTPRDSRVSMFTPGRHNSQLRSCDVTLQNKRQLAHLLTLCNLS